MATSFAAQKIELDDACKFLRSFTLGQQGFTRRDGVTGMKRVKEKCASLTKLFSSGPDAQRAAMLVGAAKSRVMAAETRLAVLRKMTQG
jgi:hypothetical protein